MNDESRKQQVIGKPPHLPLSVALSVAFRSIKVRLSRSLVTVSSVVLAVTFLLVVLGGEISSNAVYRNWQRDVRPAEDSIAVRALLQQPRSVLALITSLRDQPQATAAYAAEMGHELPDYDQEVARQAMIMADWLRSLKPSQRYLIVRNDTIGDWLLAYDAQAEEVTSEPSTTPDEPADTPTEGAATEQLPPDVAYVIEVGSTFTGTRLPLANDQLLALAEDMPQLRDAVHTLQTVEQARLQQVQDAGGAQAVIDRFINGGEGIRAAGMPLSQLLLGLDEQRRKELREQFAAENLRLQVQEILSASRTVTDPDNGREETLPPLGLGALVNGELDDHPHSEEIQQELAAQIGVEQLGVVRQDLLRRRVLDDLRGTFTAMNYNPEEGKERTMWLVLLSLMVCIVGIVNSMMMAVTERFREIATMKCLGAMDGFILKTFMIESGSVGFVGAILGAFIGFILVLLQSSSRFGSSFWTAFPASYLFYAALASLVCGLILTILGALLPAYKAARMHPIEAMRLEA